jgi:hypothetical protein
LNVIVVFPSDFAGERALAKLIQKTYKGIRSITIEGNCIICETDKVIDLACALSKMFGVERVAIAIRVSSNFSKLFRAIVEAGSRIVIPGDRFYVKVNTQPPANPSFMDRDVEFACTGTLAAKLASIHASPARTEVEATRLILTVVGKKSAYICIKIMDARGGLIVGSQGTAVSTMHGSLSLITCMMSAKSGFDCSSILLPYVDESDLEINAKLAQLFAARTGRKKQTILATPIKVPAKGNLSLLLRDIIVSKSLIQCRGKVIAFPLTSAFHPIWFIESTIRDAVFANKIPVAPIISMSSELGNYAKEVGIDLNISPSNIRKDRLQRYNNAIEVEARSAIKYMRKLELKVGPNYLHDIIDSI